MSFPFRIDSFSAQVLAFSCVFCIGIFFASCVRCIFHSKKSHSKTKRFSSACVFLTFAAIFYTILIFYSESLLWVTDFERKNPGYYEILGVVFALGFLISLFWKVALPVFLVLYVSLALFTNYILTTTFGEQKTTIPIHVEADSSAKSINLLSCRLPDTLVLPVRRDWFCVSDPFPKSDLEITKNPLVEFYTNSVLLKNISSPESFSIPATTFYPALYSAHINFVNGTLDCQITLDL